MRSPAALVLGLLTLIPAGAAAQVDDLSLTKSGDDVVVSWTVTGNEPYRVFRTRDPNFVTGNRLVGENLYSSSVVDPGALQTAEMYFYAVLDGAEANPELWDLNPPRPVPTISLLSPDHGQAGDTVTIDGTNFPEAASGLRVFFGALPADILTVSATELTVQVPDEVATSDVIACVAAEVCSNGVRFTVTVGGSFLDISSLAFEPGTGSLWVADRSTSDTIYEIDSTGNRTGRASIAEPFLSNPSPGNGNGRIYYANGTVSSFNQGTTKYLTSADNAVHDFRSAGVSSSDPVWARGMVANDSEGDTAYFMDGNNNTIRKVPNTGLIDYNWGDTTFTFNDPAGGRFDSSGNLYVSSTTGIYKITPGQTTTLVAGGFSSAAGLDLSEDTGIATLLVADEGSGDVILVDAETGAKNVAGEGFTNPVAAVFSEDPSTGAVYYDVAEPTRIVRLADPRVTFDPNPKVQSEVKVLISSQGDNQKDPFPSPYQTENRKIRIKATVTPAYPGQTVYFRVVDPKDGNQYASTGANDNKDPIGTTSVGLTVGVDPTSAQEDAAGDVYTTLTITGIYSGDNYQVEASTTAPPNFAPMGRSAIYTAWKRAYVEYDRMYKVGEFITQTSGAGQAAPASWVYVANPATFSVGDEVHVFSGSINSPDFPQELMEGEKGNVDSVAADHIVLTTSLSHTYSEPITPTGFPFSFVARVQSGYYDVPGALGALPTAFDDTHVEVKPDGDGNSFLPAWPNTNGDPNFINDRTSYFFKNYDWAAGKPAANHIQVVAAGEFGGAVVTFGKTASDSNWSWVFAAEIGSWCTAQSCTPTEESNVEKDVSTHECVHEWDVNMEPGNPVGGGHDHEHAWDNPSRPCLMDDDNRDPRLGVAKLHANLAAPSKDLYCIRGHVDDLNQTTCTW